MVARKHELKNINKEDKLFGFYELDLLVYD